MRDPPIPWRTRKRERDWRRLGIAQMLLGELAERRFERVIEEEKGGEGERA